MRKSLAAVLFVFIAIFFNSAFAGEGSQPGPEADYFPGEILVRFRRDVTPNTSRAMIQSLGMTTLSVVPGLEVHRLQLPSGVTVRDGLAKYRQDPRVEFAEPNYIARVCIPLHPDDPHYIFQWALPRINAPAAWGETTGSPAVTIAILDTGVDLDHEDLMGKIVAGWDFVDNDDIPQDADGHGTHVAGIAAAMTNNARGIAGVDWQAMIMPVRVLGADGTGTVFDTASGIIWATDRGADVINLSLGSPSPSLTLEEAVRYAHQLGVVVVAAAGNEDGPVGYPAAFDRYVLAVAATDNQDRRATPVTTTNPPWGSNFGPEVDVAAPGVDIFSTYWRPDPLIDTYWTASGTSMSAPHVAGLASLLIAHFPLLSNNEIKARIKFTADDVNSLSYPGEDIYLGEGRINAHAALTAPLTPALRFISHYIDDDNILPSRGNNDKAAGPGETIELTVTLKNHWDTAHSVSATLSSPSADITIRQGRADFQDIEPGDATSLIIDRGHQADNNNNPYVFEVADRNELIGTRVRFTLEITAAAGYLTTQHFYITINDIQPRILLVDDDGGLGFEKHFKNTLEHLGFGYTVWDVQQEDPPGSGDLKNYHIVIWTTGDDTAGTLTFSERRSLMEYLESGGRLYLSSMDVVRNVPDFSTYYLRVNTLVDITVVRAGEIGGPMELTFDYGGVGLADRSHSFVPLLEGGVSSFLRDEFGGGAICGLKFVGHYALVFTSFAFEVIVDGPDPNNQRGLLNRIIRWLDIADLTADNQDPNIPQGLTVTDSVGGVSLNWQDNFEPDVVAYEIWRHRTGGRFPTLGDATPRHIATVGGNITFFRDTPPIDRDIPAMYHYQIRAVDEAGNKSDFSEVVYDTPTPAPEGDGAAAGGCFITTVAYGTSLAPEVRVLADFRDRYLLTNAFGQKLVAFYERHSPPLAAYISTRPVLKTAVRGILRPLVWLLSPAKNDDLINDNYLATKTQR